MTERSNEVATAARFAREQWPVVLTAVLAGALAAGAWAYLRAPDPGFVATQRVRVATGVVGVPSVPTVDSVISAVSSADVRASVAETLGISASALGAVTAAIDGKNTSVVVVSARRASSEEAQRVVRAVAVAARERVLQLVDPNLTYQRTTLEAQRRRIPELRSRLADLERQVADPKIGALERAVLQQSVTDVLTQAYTAEDRADTAELAVRQTERYAFIDGEARVARGARTGYLVSSVLRGLLLGLLAGVAIAWARHWLGSRGAPA